MLRIKKKSVENVNTLVLQNEVHQRENIRKSLKLLRLTVPIHICTYIQVCMKLYMDVYCTQIHASAYVGVRKESDKYNSVELCNENHLHFFFYIIEY